MKVHRRRPQPPIRRRRQQRVRPRGIDAGHEKPEDWQKKSPAGKKQTEEAIKYMHRNARTRRTLIPIEPHPPRRRSNYPPGELLLTSKPYPSALFLEFFPLRHFRRSLRELPRSFPPRPGSESVHEPRPEEPVVDRPKQRIVSNGQFDIGVISVRVSRRLSSFRISCLSPSPLIPLTLFAITINLKVEFKQAELRKQYEI